MDLFESFRFVVKNMIEKKMRVLLTLAGIIIGIFTFTFFMFAAQGLQNAVYEQFASLGANVVGIQRAGQSGGPPTGEGLTDKELSKVKQVVREYKYVAPGIFYNARFEYGKDYVDTLALSYPDEYLLEVQNDLGIDMLEGRPIRPNDRGSITMGYKLAKEGFGDNEIKVGTSIKVGEKSFRVVGISEEQGDLFVDNSVFMNFEDIKEISGQDTYSVIRIKFLEGADLDYYIEALDRKLNPNDEEKNVDITSAMQVMEQFNQIVGLLAAIVGFISSVALIVGGINVMNTMYSNVIERTNEISVMKALGATNENILTLFLLESSMLGLLGGTLGFMLSYLFAELLSYLITNYAGYNVPIYFDITFFAIVLIATIIFATLFGTYPAMRAAHVNPADNLKDE